jgi:hypothetical protein
MTAALMPVGSWTAVRFVMRAWLVALLRLPRLGRLPRLRTLPRLVAFVRLSLDGAVARFAGGTTGAGA